MRSSTSPWQNVAIVRPRRENGVQCLVNCLYLTPTQEPYVGRTGAKLLNGEGHLPRQGPRKSGLFCVFQCISMFDSLQRAADCGF